VFRSLSSEQDQQALSTIEKFFNSRSFDGTGDNFFETYQTAALRAEMSKLHILASGSGAIESCTSPIELVLGAGILRSVAKLAAGSAAKGVLKPLGLGSTAKAGVSRVNPVNLTEELALKEIMGNPSMGNIAKLKRGMTDSRWPQNVGWQKMTWNNGGV